MFQFQNIIVESLDLDLQPLIPNNLEFGKYSSSMGQIQNANVFIINDFHRQRGELSTICNSLGCVDDSVIPNYANLFLKQMKYNAKNYYNSIIGLYLTAFQPSNKHASQFYQDLEKVMQFVSLNSNASTSYRTLPEYFEKTPLTRLAQALPYVFDKTPNSPVYLQYESIAQTNARRTLQLKQQYADSVMSILTKTKLQEL